ncbi:MAG: nucleotide exchange factor GrpE, partial [Chloroflexi bacterium]|nr:nucleotide exchange factor GrpE [Chloroflexota bacterium]
PTRPDERENQRAEPHPTRPDERENQRAEPHPTRLDDDQPLVDPNQPYADSILPDYPTRLAEMYETLRLDVRLAVTASANRQEQRLEEVEQLVASLPDTVTSSLNQFAETLAGLTTSQTAELTASYAASATSSSDLISRLTALEKQLVTQINRAGREQLKTNTLIEAQQAQFGEALDLLKTNEKALKAEIADLRERNRAELLATQNSAGRTARLEVVQGILPALDGLDEALRSGQQLLSIYEKEKELQLLVMPHDQPKALAPTPRPRLLARWLTRRQESTASRKAPVAQPPATQPTNQTERLAERPAEEKLRQGMSAWLVGLTFVRQRLLDLLADEGIEPILAQGQPYNPQLQLVVDVVPASADFPPGTVVSEVRRGYLTTGSRVLRYAEVTVAQ